MICLAGICWIPVSSEYTTTVSLCKAFSRNICFSASFKPASSFSMNFFVSLSYIPLILLNNITCRTLKLGCASENCKLVCDFSRLALIFRQSPKLMKRTHSRGIRKMHEVLVWQEIMILCFGSEEVYTSDFCFVLVDRRNSLVICYDFFCTGFPDVSCTHDDCLLHNGKK